MQDQAFFDLRLLRHTAMAKGVYRLLCRVYGVVYVSVYVCIYTCTYMYLGRYDLHLIQKRILQIQVEVVLPFHFPIVYLFLCYCLCMYVCV